MLLVLSSQNHHQPSMGSISTSKRRRDAYTIYASPLREPSKRSCYSENSWLKRVGALGTSD